ncbi:MAG: hypothetical protein AUI14_04320 [Actinobacteria bacterium 13_2_20CM_2_71_6]|nr:MAG: hypothetical protein AUI14_04320 [Actinobacteria bacterium 13_2_20CM_2_71_6]
MTRSACNCATVPASSPVRRAWASPACGPLPVTTVPAASTAAVTPNSSQDSARSGAPTTGRTGPAGSRVTTQNRNAAAITAIDSRKWLATSHGFRWVRTVAPPSRICAGIPAKTSAAQVIRSRRRETCATASTSPATARMPTTLVSVRLPNSIAPWYPSACVVTRDFSSHWGHDGQPRPEPVSRTAPPVITIPTLATSDARAVRRSRPGRSSRARRRLMSPCYVSPAGPWPRGGPYPGQVYLTRCDGSPRGRFALA